MTNIQSLRDVATQTTIDVAIAQLELNAAAYGYAMLVGSFAAIQHLAKVGRDIQRINTMFTATDLKKID